jgi:diguanylate cyclase (GGDEF)-like protein/hemerythrin-like metal-binding protein/PAS domain S-box-containing protein
LLLAVLVAAPVAQAKPEEPVTLQLKWKHQFQFAGYYAALAKGYYKEAGLDVRLVEAPPGQDPVDRVVSGAAEFGVGTSELLLRRSRGEPVVVLAVVFQHSPQVLVARRGEELGNVHDLVGKRVMIEPGAAELLAYLQREGIPPSRFTRLPNGIDVADLLEGRADAISAYVTDEPFVLRKSGLDHLIFTPRAAGIDFYGDNLFTTEAQIQAHPDRVKAFREASLRGWNWAMDHPEEIVQLIFAQYGQRHSEEHLRYEARQMRSLISSELVEVGYMNPDRWRHIADTYAELGMLAADMPLKGFLYEANPKANLGWVYRVLGGVAGVAILAGLILAHVSRLNRRLRREVQERKAAELRFRGLVDQSLAGIYIIQNSHFVYVNARFAEIFGYEADEITGTLGALDLTAVSDREWVRENLRKSLASDAKSIQYAFSAVRKDGSLIDLEVNGKAFDYEGRPAIVGVALDVTEHNRTQKLLKHMAFYDSLTDLPNRALFFDRLRQELARCKRSREGFALMVLDLDGFKAVNDAHGHEMGDALLQEVAICLRNCVRDSDTVARTGGDEFVILLHDVGDPADASQVAEKVIAALNKPFALSGRECRVGVSIGICLAPEDGDDMESLLSRADAAMYESKAQGKGTWTRFRPELVSGKPVKVMFLEWREELAVGVPVIDEQHAQMAAVLNRIADAVKTGLEQDRIRALLEELVAITRHHFQTEERLMERFKYAGIEAHKQEHRKLVEELLSLQRQVDYTSSMLTLQSLKEWLTDHVTHADREFGEALASCGAAKSPGTR